MKIFISSTFEDLKEHRRAVRDAILQLGYHPIAMEYFGARPTDPQTAAFGEIEQCGALVGIYAHRFGWVPDGDARSITEQEYDFARAHNIPCFCYRVKKDFPWDDALKETGTKAEGLARFLAEIDSQLLRAEFTTPEDLAVKVVADLGRELPKMPTVVEKLVRGIADLPTRYDGRVKNFLEYYLGVPGRPAPFGGRQADLDALDQWLIDPNAPHYALLVAPAGRGKSGLLAKWLTHLSEQPKTDVIYFPISIRFNTNLETVVFAALAARMAHLYGEKVTEAFDAQQYRGVFSDYLRRAPKDGRQILVILDGLDEAAGWNIGADLFPIVPLDHLKVIVAARPLVEDVGSTTWMQRLGWNAVDVRSVELGRLDRVGVADVLVQIGNPLAELAQHLDVVGKLLKLSEGDPLLVRLYVEALTQQGEQAAVITADDLLKLKPGLKAYFDRWFEEQRKLWGEASLLKDKSVRSLLNLCSTALGPLKQEDLLALAPDYFDHSFLVREAAHAVQRFVIGDGETSGYVFSHPRLNEYFAGRLSPIERKRLVDRFLEYGKTTLQKLKRREIKPVDASAYIVQYYGVHLERTEAPDEDIYALVCEEWLHAWEAITGTPDGFLDDMHRVWNKAELRGASELGLQIRVALCFSSVASISANIDSDLLAKCVKTGVVTPTLALVLARRKPDPEERSQGLSSIAQVLPKPQQTSIMLEALTVARAIADGSTCARVLGELAPQLPNELLPEALTAARAITDEYAQANVLGALAPHLPKKLLSEVLTVARAITNESAREDVLRGLTPYLPKELLPELFTAACVITNEFARMKVLAGLAPHLPKEMLPEALTMVRSVTDESDRASAILAIALHLPEQEQAAVFTEALSAARAITYSERARARILRALAPHLPEQEQEAVFTEALSAACEIIDEIDRAEALKELAPYLSKELLSKALTAARVITNKFARMLALVATAPFLPKPEQAAVFADALTTAHAISGDSARVNALVALALHLPAQKQVAVFNEAFTVARAIKDESARASDLADLAPHLPKELFPEALAAARTITNEFDRARILRALASHLPEQEQVAAFTEALIAARAIADESARADILIALAPHLPEQERVAVFTIALTTARAIADESARMRFLSSLAPRLPKELLPEALATARTITNESNRASILGELAPHLPEQDQMAVLAEAFTVARAIKDEFDRANALGELAPHLSKELLLEAFTASCAITNESDRASALGELAPHLPRELLPEAFTAGCAITNELDRARVLSKLAPHLPQEMIPDALTAARAITHESAQHNSLRILAPHLSKEALSEALTVARTIRNEFARARVLEELAPYLPKELFPEALTVVRAITDEFAGPKALVALAPYLPTGLLPEAFTMARAIRFESERPRAFGALAPFLPKGLLPEALTAACLITDASAFARALDELAPHLPKELLPEALTAARAITHESARARALSALVPYLPEHLLRIVLGIVRQSPSKPLEENSMKYLAEHWEAIAQSNNRSEFAELSLTLHAFAPAERGILLAAISALTPVIVKLGGQKAIRETVQAIVDTARWWP